MTGESVGWWAKRSVPTITSQLMASCRGQVVGTAQGRLLPTLRGGFNCHENCAIIAGGGRVYGRCLHLTLRWFECGNPIYRKSHAHHSMESTASPSSLRLTKSPDAPGAQGKAIERDKGGLRIASHRISLRASPEASDSARLGICFFLNHNAARTKPRVKIRSGWRPRHDRSAAKRKSWIAPPRLLRLRHGIFLRPVRIMLVRRGNRSPADAGRWRGLPVPGLFAEDGGSVARTGVILKRSPFNVPRTQRSAQPLRSGALQSRGPGNYALEPGSRLCEAA
jgi:hypothetical protein